MKTILIDMYGVILNESKGNFIPYTFNYFDSIHHERLTLQIRNEGLFSKAQIGEISSNEFLHILGYDDPQYHMKNYIENYLTLDEGFISFAEKYHKIYDFVLLSNDVAEWSTYITEYYNLNKFFKAKIVSGNIGYKKPDRKIFDIALTQIGKRPENCLFVDNSVENLKAAERMGLKNVLFNRDNEIYDGAVVYSFSELDKILQSL
ncbi:MAG: HAD family hydrolase [Ruminococcaceae bacterium]|nr:HAD family hydrolase [Oscillospiraceae bacterium]